MHMCFSLLVRSRKTLLLFFKKIKHFSKYREHQNENRMKFKRQQAKIQAKIRKRRKIHHMTSELKFNLKS